MNRLQLEIKIGPAGDLVVSHDNRHLLAQWAATLKGVPHSERSTMVDIINLYHNPPAVVPTERQLKAANDLYRQLMGDAPEPVAERHTLTHAATDEIIEIAKLGDDIMMVGPAGCGKTTIGLSVSRALDLPFYITSTVFDTHELMGFVDGHGHYHTTAFRKAFETGGVWVADEIDAWDAAALLAANSALAQGLASFPDSPEPVIRHPDFLVIATANTFGKGADRVYIGRNELDAASLDRFAIIEIDYDPKLEIALCAGNTVWLEYVLKVREQVLSHKIRHVVSTRAIVKGARALAAGIRMHRVEKIYVFKGMSKSDREKLKGV